MHLRRFLTGLLPGLWLAAVLAAEPLADGAAKGPVDWERARELNRRAAKGEALTAGEREYLMNAREQRARQNRPPPGRVNRQEPDRPARPGRPGPDALPEGGFPFLDLVPLTELDGTNTYKGQDGGLYGKGSNTPPERLREALLKKAAEVRPLDREGRPDPGGKIGLVAIGMSNTTREFSEFMRMARADGALSPALVLVDGAQGGMAGREWAQAGRAREGKRGDPWLALDERVRDGGLAASQVQAAWIKQAEKNPQQLGAFPKHADVLAASLEAIVLRLRERFPNLKLVFLSSRIYAGYAVSGLNPEPYAYEGGFAVRQVILKQAEGRAPLSLDEPGMPVLLWGPYLWADGDMGRRADGLVYTREDFASDGTHPSPSGSRKVAGQLLDFLKTDPASRGWFISPAPVIPPPR